MLVLSAFFLFTPTHFLSLPIEKKNQQLRARLIKLFCYIIPNSESMISTHADWETVVFQVQFYCVLKLCRSRVLSASILMWLNIWNKSLIFSTMYISMHLNTTNVSHI